MAMIDRATYQRICATNMREGRKAERAEILTLLRSPGEEMVERVARETRRNRFVRTRVKAFDEAVPLTENELDDARASLAALADFLEASHGERP